MRTQALVLTPLNLWVAEAAGTRGQESPSRLARPRGVPDTKERKNCSMGRKICGKDSGMRVVSLIAVGCVMLSFDDAGFGGLNFI